MALCCGLRPQDAGEDSPAILPQAAGLPLLVGIDANTYLTRDPKGGKKFVELPYVVKGMDVVKAIERVGSQSGTTSKPVMVANCGQI